MARKTLYDNALEWAQRFNDNKATTSKAFVDVRAKDLLVVVPDGEQFRILSYKGSKYGHNSVRFVV